MRWTRVVPIVLLVVGVGVATAYFAHVIPSTKGDSAAPPLAPNFTLTDIHGNNFTLSDYRSNTVVAVEFTALSCSECKIVEQSLQLLYSHYDGGGASRLQIVSVFIEPQFGDTIPALQAHQTANGVEWVIAQDTNSLDVSRSYGVSEIPTVIIIDKQGQAVYDVAGVQDSNQLQATIDSALAGTATAVSIVTVSVFALAAIAGVSTFFSPCAFPMFPGYMSLFLGLTATNAGSTASTVGTYKGAARRALFAGSITALGMIVVFSIIGVALIYAASLVGANIPYFQIIVGVVLVGLGFLLLTNLQYWRLITPLQRLWRWIGGNKSAELTVAPSPSEGRGFYLKLFSYGMGYAAAAAGCVAPVIFAAILAGLALGLLGGIINILIYSLTAALLMIAVTLMLGMAGQRYVNQLKAYTPLIKKISAVALILVGVYLIYFFYLAWGI